MNKSADKLVLLSGGLDSMVNLAEAVNETPEVEALFVNYGQLAAVREEQSAREQCEFFNVKLETVELPWYRRLLPPPLSCAQKVANADDSDVWAPNRNGLLVAIGAAFAEAKDITEIITGFNAEEAATFPDNSPQFVAVYNELLKLSTKNGVKLSTYTEKIDKKAIVKRALELDAPLESVFSCYGAGPIMCGKCISCSRLKAALNANGLTNEFSLLFKDR